MIDHERLRELEEDFGADQLQQILASFLEETAAAMEALRAGWRDPAVRRDRLHFVKGCARTVGAAELGDICESLEADPDPGRDGLRRLEHEFRQVGDAIDRHQQRQEG